MVEQLDKKLETYAPLLKVSLLRKDGYMSYARPTRCPLGNSESGWALLLPRLRALKKEKGKAV